MRECAAIGIIHLQYNWNCQIYNVHVIAIIAIVTRTDISHPACMYTVLVSLH